MHPLSARALTAATMCPPPTITASTLTEESGSCAHIQLNSARYGAGTPAASIPGYQPADLQSAYRLPSLTAGKNQTIGIVVAGTSPSAEADLAVYRSTFGLPACGIAGNCLSFIAGDGSALTGKNMPTLDVNWAAELAIDLDMASAICPNCKLLVVIADSTKSSDLAAAAQTAVSHGATVVSNSFVIPESHSIKTSGWSTLGVPVVAAAGDGGYNAVTNWPASASNVIAVGGTTLVPNSTARGWSETAWSGSGSGCSSLAAKPSWQTDTGCANRSVADVAAVADPATPVAVFNTYQSTGWVLMAGTSVATPIVAGVYALAGNGSHVSNAASLYANRGALNPISSGSNGTCSPSYLCTAGPGYNGPTGLGSPNGIAAF